MSLAPPLAALVALLHGRCQVPATLGRPDGVTPGLHVWPWRLSENLAARNVPRPRRPGGEREAPLPATQIHFLILASPILAPAGLDALAAARTALLEMPLLSTPGGRYDIYLEPLATTELTAVFNAAGLPLQLCLSGLLRPLA